MVLTAGWTGRTVVVTGAAGLLGGWVARELAASGAKVRGVDLEWSGWGAVRDADGVEQVQGDIRDAAFMNDVLDHSGTDTVIHLAAQAIVGEANEDPVPTFEHNILGTWTVLEACRRHPSVSRIVAASSDKAYGDTGGSPYEEDMPLRADHPYSASKACSDLIARTYAASFGLPVAISRCGNLYGGGDLNWSRIVPGTIRSVLEAERPVIRSDGTFVRDYLYVEDAAAGIIALADQVGERAELAGEAFNFGADQRMTVLEVVREILGFMRSDLEPEIRSETVNEIPDQRVNADKARKLLEWEPSHSRAEGFERTISWYREYLAR